MNDNITQLAIPQSAREPALECPWSGVAVPVKQAGGVGFVMQRAECTSACALFDRVNRRPGCVVDMRPQIEALTAAVNECVAATKGVGAK